MNPLSSLLLTLILSLSHGISGVAEGEPPPLARDRLGPIYDQDYHLYVRARFEDLKRMRPNLPSPSEILEDFSIHRLLAAKAEVQFASWEKLPEVRWGLWGLECGESENRLIEEVLRPAEDPSPEEIERYYREHRANFARVGSFSIRRVFFDATRCEAESCRKDLERKARETLAKMLGDKKPGDGEVPLEDFLAAATWATGSPTSAFQVSGPHSLGKLSRALEEAAMALEPGEVSDVIPTKFGFHILRLETKEAPRLLSLEEAAPSILETLKYRKTHDNLIGLRARLRASETLKVRGDTLAAFVASATMEGVNDAAPLGEAGPLKIAFKDLRDLLKIRPLGVIDDEQPYERLLETYRTHLVERVLLPEIVRQEAIQHGVTSDSTYELRYRMDRMAHLGKLLFERELRKRIAALPPISSTQVEEYYQTHQEDFMTKPQYILREIAIQPRAATRPSEMEFALREAEEKALRALAEIEAGTPEENAVKRWSDGGEAERGGVTPPLAVGTRYAKPVWDALLQLPPGAWTKPPFRHLGKAVVTKVEEAHQPPRRTFEDGFQEITVRLSLSRET
ncbi:MAG: peptidyl-prolyl cis-trans isomerase, partial [Candidatus Omnitrophica bacterium]|nr:peptidyl-prolyl cis-trans isomerase [Candidatus Omnitrophota bacterium]